MGGGGRRVGGGWDGSCSKTRTHTPRSGGKNDGDDSDDDDDDSQHESNDHSHDDATGEQLPQLHDNNDNYGHGRTTTTT